jgi:hypothetical protein
MKMIICFTAIAFLSLSSCRKEAATLTKDQTLAKSQSQTNASSSGGAVAFSDVFTVSNVGESLYNPCTNEIVTFISGTLLIDVHGIYNGNKSTITVHANFQDAKMVGESGREYAVSGSFNEQTSDFSNGIFTTKLVHFDRGITAGSENNIMIKDTYYIKVDADGNVTVIRDESHETYCQ